MTLVLLNVTPLEIAVKAIRKCYDSCGDDLGEKDLKLLRSIIKNKHLSTIEHIYFTFEIDGISRACLQELARHRHASLSVRSTRYTLRELMKEELGTFVTDYTEAEKYLVFTGNKEIDIASAYALEALKKQLLQGTKNDIAKYMLPESYKTSLVWTINARSLRNFLELRSSSKALWEMRNLSSLISLAIPEEYNILFEDILRVPQGGII